jgi:hypothetical protein
MRIVRAVLLSVLALPLFGAGHDVTARTFGPAAYPYPIGGPSVVSNGSTFLTTWSANVPQGSPNLYGALSDADGKPIGDPFLLFASAYDKSVMVADGKYLISAGNAVYELGSDRVLHKITDLPATARASTGDTFLCVELRIENYTFAGYAEVIARDGRMISSTPIGFLRRAAEVSAAAVGNDYVFKKQLDDKVYRVSISGSLSQIAQHLFGAPVIATNGRDILVLQPPNGSIDGPYAAGLILLTADGLVRGSAVLPPGPFVFGFNVTSDGDDFIIVELLHDAHSGTGNGNVAMRFDTATATLSAPHDVGTVQSIASNGATLAGAGNATAAAGVRVEESTLDAAFNEKDRRVLSIAQRRQFAPVIASDGVNFLSVFNDQTADEQAISFARLSSAAAPLDGAGKDAFRFAGSMGDFSVAYGGGTYLVVWHWWKQIWAARVARDGTLIDTTPILVRDAPNVSKPHVAWSGSSFLVTWLEPGNSEQFIHAASIDAAGHVGAVHDVVRQVSSAQLLSSIGPVDIAWTGHSFLLAMQIDHSEVPLFPVIGARQWSEVQLLRVAADGTPIDATPTSILNATKPQVASNTAGALLIYVATDGLHGALIPPDDQPPATAATHPYSWPVAIDALDVTWNGSEYVIATRYDVYLDALVLAPEGTILDRKTVTANVPEDPPSVSVVSNGSGQTLIDVSEVTSPGESARNRTYALAEMHVPRAAPSASIVDAVRIAPDRVLVTWSADGADRVIVTADDVGTGPLPASSKSVVLQTVRATTVRVYAWNEGGVSPTTTVPVHSTRQRAASR